MRYRQNTKSNILYDPPVTEYASHDFDFMYRLPWINYLTVDRQLRIRCTKNCDNTRYI